MNYNPFRTAIPRKSLSVPTRVLLNKNLLFGSILDYGCGYGYDVKYLKPLGFNIKGYDKFNEEFNKNYLLNNTYDNIICNYVFNVINLQDHKELLNKLKTMSNNVYISVRSDNKSIKDNWVYVESEEYWLTSKGTYQRFYTDGMINKYFGEVEYISNNSNYKLFKLNI